MKSFGGQDARIKEWISGGKELNRSKVSISSGTSGQDGIAVLQLLDQLNVDYEVETYAIFHERQE